MNRPTRHVTKPQDIKTANWVSFFLVEHIFPANDVVYPTRHSVLSLQILIFDFD